MTKKLEKTQRYDATPEQVWDMLLNEDFVQEKCTAAGATEVSVETLQEDGGTTLVCRRVLPAKLPGFAKKFVGESITITETQRWKDRVVKLDRRNISLILAITRYQCRAQSQSNRMGTEPLCEVWRR